MKRNLNLMNLASYCNLIGNTLIGLGSLSIIFGSINYLHNYNNIMKESKQELIYKHKIFTQEEFEQIEAQSNAHAEEDLLTLMLGKWASDHLRSDNLTYQRLKRSLSDKFTAIRNYFNKST
jgi:hypothetical protein